MRDLLWKTVYMLKFKWINIIGEIYNENIMSQIIPHEYPLKYDQRKFSDKF